MGIVDRLAQFYGTDRTKAVRPLSGTSRPLEMIFRFAPNAPVAWYQDTGTDFVNNGYLGNHIVFSIQDWKSQKVSIAPPMLYKVVNEKAHRKYKALLKSDDRRKGLSEAMRLKGQALEEVEGSELAKLLQRPNPQMGWSEFAYGYCTYKDIVGAAYFAGVRSGVDDPTEGKIREMYLLPSHHVVIESGGITQPIREIYLRTSPDKKIDARNVCQIRNFSPNYDQPYQFLYGLSRLQAANSILQKYNEGVATEVDTYQKRGIRDIIFPKSRPDMEDPTVEQVQLTKDSINRDIQSAGHGGVMATTSELGSIRVGLSPKDMGVLESQKLTKQDFCALYHIPWELFAWSESKYDNLSVSRKIALTDAVIPELEALKDALNHWLVPSYYPDGNYVLDFDYEYYPELQDDIKDTVDWMEKANCLTTNEKRAALRYGATEDPNGDRVIVSGNMQFLEDVGTDSFSVNPNLDE